MNVYKSLRLPIPYLYQGVIWCSLTTSFFPHRPAFFRPVILARELTKLHEEIFRGTLAQAAARYGTLSADEEPSTGAAAGSATKKDPKGEFTVVLGPRVAMGQGGEGSSDSASAMAALEARWGLSVCMQTV